MPRPGDRFRRRAAGLALALGLALLGTGVSPGEALARGNRAEKALRDELRRSFGIDSVRDERARVRAAKRHKPRFDQPRRTFATLRAAILLGEPKRVKECLSEAARAQLATLPAVQSSGGTWPAAKDWRTYYLFMATRYYGHESEAGKARVALETRLRDPANPSAVIKRRSLIPMERIDGKWLITDAQALIAVAAQGAPAPVRGATPPPAAAQR